VIPRHTDADTTAVPLSHKSDEVHSVEETFLDVADRPAARVSLQDEEVV